MHRQGSAARQAPVLIQKGGRMILPRKENKEQAIRSSAAEYLTYVASIGDQQDSLEMRYEDENIWLTQKMMATLYGVSVSTINEHIKKVFWDSELEEDSVRSGPGRSWRSYPP